MVVREGEKTRERGTVRREKTGVGEREQEEEKEEAGFFFFFSAVRKVQKMPLRKKIVEQEITEEKRKNTGNPIMAHVKGKGKEEEQHRRYKKKKGMEQKATEEEINEEEREMEEEKEEERRRYELVC